MTSVDTVLHEFIAAHRAGDAPEPDGYLDRLSGTDRAELAVRIDAYLADAPRLRSRSFRASQDRPARAAFGRLAR